MQKLRQINIKNAAVLLIIGLLGILVANQTLYVHSHITSDGRVITHAHPYNESEDSAPYKSHQHSKSEFIFLKSLQILFFTFFASLLLFNISYQVKIVLYRPSKYTSPFQILRSGRAPPFYTIFP
jgi:Mn2+/Fe2+ NRAMP family transporter